ncbi:MAG: aminomethyl-transferring glycine dehydrogenase subunit GcvPA [Magnetovibrionaceae bacterium]
MRYLPLTEADRSQMLKTIGAGSVDELFRDVPDGLLQTEPLDLPLHQGEWQVERAFEAMAAKNTAPSHVPSFLGGGLYRHHVPASVDYMIQRGEFLTSYTPYQPEVSQGTLQYLFEFQTQVANMMAMPIANASLYDGATACAEAVLMAARATRRKRIVLSGSLHPHYTSTTETHAKHLDLEIETAPLDITGSEDLSGLIDDQTACIVVQNPDFFGNLRDFSALADAAHDKGALIIFVVNEVVSLGLVTPPGDMGADVVAGEGASLGVGPNFGGPTVGLFAVRDKFLRQMPGRVCGETVDADGRRGYVLTLSTREQHIRREKATSNICTNSGLCALAFTIHASLLGEEGFTRLARLNHEAAIDLADRLDRLEGAQVITGSFFNEFTIRLSKPAGEVVEALAAKNILAGVPASRLLPGQTETENLLIVAATELTSDADCAALEAGLKEVL